MTKNSAIQNSDVDNLYDIAYESGYVAGQQKGVESQWVGLAALQLLRELNVSPSSAELIEAYHRHQNAAKETLCK